MSQAHDQKHFTISEVVYLPAMTLDGAAQLAAAHCPNEWTLARDMQLDRPTMPRPATQGLHPAMLSGSVSLF